MYKEEAVAVAADVISADEETMCDSNEKVQEWLDTYEHDINILFPSTPSSYSTPASSILIPSYNEKEGTQNAAIVLFSSSSSSSSSGDDMQGAVQGIDRIWNCMEAMINQQAFDAAFDVGSVRYLCDEVVRILNLLGDEYYMPPSGLLLHILRWAVYAVEERCGKLQWRIDIIEKVKDSIKSQYARKIDACDD